MNEFYTPDNQFVERLEWQLSSEFRRASRLKPSSGRISVSHRMVAVSCVVGTLMTGVAIVKAADYIKDSWRKKIEIARAETEVQLKKAYSEYIRGMETSDKARVSSGLIREEEYLVKKRAADKADLDLKKSLLNLEEVKMSGDIPRDELYAPVVRGRDFVSERLEIDKKEVELDLELLKSQARRFEQLVEKNLIRREELIRIQAEMAAQEREIGKIQKRLELRGQFLAGEVSALEVELRDLKTAAETNLELAQSRINSLNGQLKRLKILEAEGAVSQLEIRQLQYALYAAEAELKLASLEMDVLKKIK